MENVRFLPFELLFPCFFDFVFSSAGSVLTLFVSLFCLFEPPCALEVALSFFTFMLSFFLAGFSIAMLSVRVFLAF